VVIGLLISSAFLYIVDVYATSAIDRYLLDAYGPGKKEFKETEQNTQFRVIL
jgi:hypothetical protein